MTGPRCRRADRFSGPDRRHTSRIRAAVSAGGPAGAGLGLTRTNTELHDGGIHMADHTIERHDVEHALAALQEVQQLFAVSHQD